jgi:hypothetical protein
MKHEMSKMREELKKNMTNVNQQMQKLKDVMKADRLDEGTVAAAIRDVIDSWSDMKLQMTNYMGN